MHIAAYANATECLLYLHSIDKLAFKARSASGHRPFHYACIGGALECAHVIVSLYEQSEIGDSLQDLFNDDYKDAKTNLPYLAAFSESPGILTIIFESGYNYEKYEKSQIEFTNLAINQVIKAKNIECLKIILRYLKPTKYSSGQTPLMLAVINNLNEAVSLLLKTKCSPEAKIADHKLIINGTPCKLNIISALSYACFSKNYEAVKMIAGVLDEKNVDIPENINAPAMIHSIVQSRDIRIAEIILQKNINVNRIDQDGRTAVHYMRDVGNEDEHIKMLDLLHKYGLNVNLCKKGKNSILGDFLSGIGKQFKIIEWLISKGADLDSKITQSGTGVNTTCRKYMEDLTKKHPEFIEILDKYSL
jgi:ankyrin repeat protein